MGFQNSGFGYGRFGNFPFGYSDYGDDVIVKSFPEVYLEDDAQNGELLLHYLQTIKDSVNEIKTLIDKVPDQISVNDVRADLIRYLASTIDVELDDIEPVEFHRSLVGSAVQFYRIKGTEASYKIRGKISGFDVDVFNIYKINTAYIPLFPTENVYELPKGSGIYFTDLPPGSVSGTPTEVSCDYCLTAQIKLNFTLVKPLPPASVGGPNFFEKLVRKLKDIIPIHVRDVLYEIRFFILADQHQYMGSQYCSDEVAFIPVHFWHRFDAIPADSVTIDNRGGYAIGTASDS